MSKPVVVHYNYELVDRTETFIYNYVSNLRTFHSIYFADNLMNLDAFPLPEGDVYQVPCGPPRKYSRGWLYAQVRKRLDGDISAEEAILRARRARLIHAHFGPQGFFALKLRGRLRIPIVTTFYGYDVSQLLAEPEWRSRYATLFREGDLFLVEGEFMKARLIDLGCPASKVQIQRIAVPLSRIPFVARRPKRKDEKAVVLFSGRFIEKKGAIYALSAIERVKRDGANVEFRMAGDGPLRPDIEAAILDLGLSDDVKMLGFLGYRDYLHEMGKADIFLHPSVTAEDGDSEGGAPTVILEAQATGMPVVTTTHADIPNVVVPGKSALLSAERDVSGLAEHLSYLLKHQDVWEEMGRAGRQFIEQHHDLDKEIDRLEDQYRSVLG